MKTSNALKIASVAAMLAVAGPAFAAEPRSDSVQTQDPVSDESGIAALGIDIRGAGSSPETIQSFMATLAPQTQMKLVNGCANINASSSPVSPSVASFCQSLGSVQYFGG